MHVANVICECRRTTRTEYCIRPARAPLKRNMAARRLEIRRPIVRVPFTDSKGYSVLSVPILSRFSTSSHFMRGSICPLKLPRNKLITSCKLRCLRQCSWATQFVGQQRSKTNHLNHRSRGKVGLYEKNAVKCLVSQILSCRPQQLF